ncbi:MAG: NADPH-dependent reductase [Francisellaceae bacterium]|nr:NADPH-dependent reductase [Francisellaceae bacterium]
MVKGIIVYHSGYGHTQKQAEAIHEGFKSFANASVNFVKIDADGNLTEDGWNALKNADAIIFGSPTYMGNVSWQFKKFADTSSKPWFSQIWKDKIAAGFTNSASMNGDKLSTLHSIFTLAMQHSMIWVSAGMLPANSKAAGRNDINYLGSYAGLMAQSPSDSTPDEGPLPGDLETAKIFGARIATIANNFKNHS